MESVITLVSLLAVVGLVAVHLFSGKLRFLRGAPRSGWLSLAGGVSVAYVFVHLIPELGESAEAVAGAFGEGLAFVDNQIYLVALVGLAAFYGLDRLATESRRSERKAGREDRTPPQVFWLHISSFAVYNVLIGYLLTERLTSGLQSLLIFFVAMALHFVVNDYGLRRDQKGLYERYGRWVISAAAVLGWVIGVLTQVPEATIAIVTAFIGGGIVLNILKEELPEERESRFWAFAAGAPLYAALLLAL